MNQSQQFINRILGWAIPIIVAVIIAVLIAVLIAPPLAQRLNVPLPTWLSPVWLSPAQNARNAAEETIAETRDAAQIEAPSSTEAEAAEWPTPPADILAASGNVTPLSTSAAPTPRATRTPYPTATIIALPTPAWREMNYLTSVKLTASTVVDAERNTSLSVLGDIRTDRLLLKAVGEVLVGIDLTRIDNVRTNGRSIQLTLPPPEIMAVELLPDKSEIYLSSRTIFLSQYEGFESEALEQARRQLRSETARNQGLIDLTTKTARLQLTEFLKTLGYENIEFVANAKSSPAAE